MIQFAGMGCPTYDLVNHILNIGAPMLIKWKRLGIFACYIFTSSILYHVFLMDAEEVIRL
jgi:hypothetical protein